MNERRYRSVLEDAAKAYQKYPEDVRFLRQTGTAAYLLKQYALASESLQRYVDETGDPDSLAHCLFMLGDSLYRQEKFQEATQALRNCLATEGPPEEHAHALYLIAMCSKRTKSYEDAVQTLDRLMTNYPNSAFIPEASVEKARLQWKASNSEYLIDSEPSG